MAEHPKKKPDRKKPPPKVEKFHKKIATQRKSHGVMEILLLALLAICLILLLGHYLRG